MCKTMRTLHAQNHTDILFKQKQNPASSVTHNTEDVSSVWQQTVETSEKINKKSREPQAKTVPSLTHNAGPTPNYGQRFKHVIMSASSCAYMCILTRSPCKQHLSATSTGY